MSDNRPPPERPAGQPQPTPPATPRQQPAPPKPATGEWSDLHKWLADVAKNLLCFLLVSLTSLFVFDLLEDARARREANRRLHYGYLLSAVEKFHEASSQYSSTTYDVIRINFFGTQVADLDVEERADRREPWRKLSEETYRDWGKAFDLLKTARISIRSWTAANESLANTTDIEAQLVAFEALLGELRKLNNELWLDAGNDDPLVNKAKWSEFSSMEEPRGRFGALRVRYASAANKIVTTLLQPY